MKKNVLFILLFNLIFANNPNIVAESDSTKPIALDAVEVLAESKSITSGMFLRNAEPSDVVSKSELDQFRYTDIHRIVGRIPGVYISEEDGLGLRPNIGVRGTGSLRMEKLNVMEDGVLIAPAPYASPAAYYSPTAGRMESIEVRKGSTQIKHGPFTTGGSLNYISTSIPTSKLNSVSLDIGSFGKTLMQVRSGDSMGKFAYLIELYSDKMDGFKELDGGGDTGYTKTDFMTKLRYSFSESHALEFKYSMTDELSDETYLGLTDADYSDNPLRRYRATALDEMDADHSQVMLSYAAKINDNMSLAIVGYSNNFARNWYKLNKVNGMSLSSITKPTADGWNEFYLLMDAENSADDAYRIKANNREYYSSGVQAVFNVNAGNHDVQAGLRIHSDEMDRFQWEDRYGMQNGKLVMTTQATKGSDSNRIDSAEATALFIEDRFTSGDMTVTAGARYEEITVMRDDWGKTDPDRSETPSQRKHTMDVVVPGIGIEYAINEFQTVSVGVHKGFAPPGPGTSGVTDKAVDPETSMNTEIGFKSNQGLNSLEFTLFTNSYDNLLGADTAASGGGSDELFNGGAVDISGFELYLRRILVDNGRIQMPLELSWTSTNSEFQESFDGFWGEVSKGDELPYLPDTMISLNLGLNVDKLSANISMKKTSEMRTVAGSGRIAESNATDELTIIDLGLRYTLQDNIRLSVGINNFMDDDGIAARRPYGARPTMPRSFSLGVDYTF
ncbi:TonB-dependent receptor [Candidatus Marinimicrobia bacterium]|nr:TonB-dependent receptor [Candidatus Neomarinimicrobiota bacterium]MDA9735983.1 TonB-dependent receptor [Candidatus Neomarinimicrobiota bacterium]